MTLVSAAAIAITVNIVAGGGANAALARQSDVTTTSVTRAAVDPSLVADRGAGIDFAEQEAEHGVTTGSIIGPDRSAYTLPAEASGREAVKLLPGQYVEFALPNPANAINVRYSIPDAPTGGGVTAPLDISVNGRHRATMTLTSQYAWLYNAYPFSNDPTLTTSIEPDWWTTECSCVPGTTTTFPAPFRPNHFYDEQRLFLGRTYHASVRRTPTPMRSACFRSAPTRVAVMTPPAPSTRRSRWRNAATAAFSFRRERTRSTATSSSTA
jgi:hypothetical protein